MGCDEAAEFVSALCDGETIPPWAAEHVGACANCQQKLQDYLAIGVELRREASIAIAEKMEPPAWHGRRQAITAFWQKGWEAMRIPRFAFALLVTGIVVLGSTLAIQKVGARSTGNVAFLKLDFGSGQTVSCALAVGNPALSSCTGVAGIDKRAFSYKIDILDRDQNRIEIGVRSKIYPPNAEATVNAPGAAASVAEVNLQPQQQVWFEPGETEKIATDEGTTITVTGEWLDHAPTFIAWNGNSDLDPAADELRIVSPLLLRDDKVAGDMEGFIVSMNQTGMAIDIYQPAFGRFIISAQPIHNAVVGKVAMNRINFTLDGEHYSFVTGSPITRKEKVWILHDANFVPKGGLRSGYGGSNTFKNLGLTPDTTQTDESKPDTQH